MSPDDPRPRPPGRPRLHDEPVTAKIELRVTPAQRLDLARVARENGTSLSTMLREAAVEHCAAYRERYPHRRPR